MSLGSKVAGVMTSSWDKFPDKRIYFIVWFIAAVIGGVLIYSRIRIKLNRGLGARRNGVKRKFANETSQTINHCYE